MQSQHNARQALIFAACAVLIVAAHQLEYQWPVSHVIAHQPHPKTAGSTTPDHRASDSNPRARVGTVESPNHGCPDRDRAPVLPHHGESRCHGMPINPQSPTQCSTHTYCLSGSIRL